MPVTGSTSPAPGTAFERERRTAPQRTRADSRARLLASGQALFAERGLHGVTSHDIAARASVAAGTFYNHFSDKAALFREITHQAVAELDRRLEQAEPADLDLRQRVPLVARALVEFAADHRDLIRILFSGDADAAAVEADVLADLARRLSEGRRQAVAEGSMPRELDPDVLAQALVGMWARVLAWWAQDPGQIAADSLIETLTRIQLSGTHPQAGAEDA